MFLLENTGGKGFGSIFGQDRAGALMEDGSFVVPFADEVDGASAHFSFRFDYGAVDVDTVHSFAAEAGE